MKIFEEKGYKYQEHLKSGGEGEIHLIKNVDKLFVAKIFPRLEDSSYELLSSLREIQIPNIPKIYELFNYEDKTVIIRDYVEGQTLYEYMKQSGPLDYTQSKAIIIRLCETLKAFHNLKPNPIVYRDLKPENIIVTPNNEIRLIDFGIARYYKKESTRDTILAGTKGYTAPEVLAGIQSDNRSDIYSVGLLLYELLTGKNLLEPPFQIRPVKESNPNLEKWIDTVIEKATDFNQTMRYSKIEDFVCDLEHPPKLNRKKKSAFVISAVLLVACALFVGYKLISPTPVKKNYTALLELEFDEEADCEYIKGYEGLSSDFSFFDGKLDVEHEVCYVDAPIENNMIVHYKIKASEESVVALGPYSVSGNSLFSCAYVDETGKDYTAWDVKMRGNLIRMDDHFVNVILSTTENNSAVYAVVIDEENQSIAYGGYQIPSNFNNLLYADMANHKYSDDSFLHVESITIIEGNIYNYIHNEFESYSKHAEYIDKFFSTDANDLPEIPLQ